MKTVTIPTNFLQELLALCGPEDHELRDRVTKSVTQAVQADARDANQWLQAGDMEALERFAETSDDDQSYDIGKEAVKRLAHFGCLESLGFGRYGITAFGSYVIVDWVGSRKLPFTTQADRDTEHRAAIAAQAAAQGGQ